MCRSYIWNLGSWEYSPTAIGKQRSGLGGIRANDSDFN